MNLIRHDTAKHITEVRSGTKFPVLPRAGRNRRYKSVHGAGTFLANYNLGLFYHVFGNTAGAKRCLESASKAGYSPATALLAKLN